MESEKHFLNETMYINELPNGIKCYIISKKAYVEKQAMISVSYGSADTHFVVDGRDMRSPDGIAHFLEHKLFADPDMDIFAEFTKQGASVNAFTNFTNTAYYYNCIDSFEDNFGLLMRLVGRPYFTDENVEKEKGIISQEINMYSDNPNWRGYMNLQNGLYHESPVTADIAGTLESVAAINKDMLYDCYNTFYYPRNMIVVCVGDIDRNFVYDAAGKIALDGHTPQITRMYGNEPPQAKQPYTEIKMSVSRPMFFLGFKENRFDTPVSKKIAASKVLIDIIAGESSTLFEKMYEDGLTDCSFGMEYSCGAYFGSALFSGFSENPQAVCERIFSEVAALKANGIDAKRFEQIKRKHIGILLKGFNSIDLLTNLQADLYTKGTDLFELADAFHNLSLECVSERLGELFLDDNHTLSVVLPE